MDGVEVEVEAEAEVEAEVEVDDSLTCEACGFVSLSLAGLGSHKRKHYEDGTLERPAEYYDPPAPPVVVPTVPKGQVDYSAVGDTVRKFSCERHPGLIIAPAGRIIARFRGGALETANLAAIAVCEADPDIEELA